MMFEIPKRYRDATIHDFTPGDFKLTLRPRKPRSIFVTGVTGSGKTHFGCALANLWGAGFLSCSDLVAMTKRTFGEGGTGEADLFDACVSQPMLVLDDISAIKKSEWSASMFYSILCRRYNDMTPTVVTSFLTQDEISEWDPSIASRLEEFEQVVLIGQGRRKDLRPSVSEAESDEYDREQEKKKEMAELIERTKRQNREDAAAAHVATQRYWTRRTQEQAERRKARDEKDAQDKVDADKRYAVDMEKRKERIKRRRERRGPSKPTPISELVPNMLDDQGETEGDEE